MIAKTHVNLVYYQLSNIHPYIPMPQIKLFFKDKYNENI